MTAVALGFINFHRSQSRGGEGVWLIVPETQHNRPDAFDRPFFFLCFMCTKRLVHIIPFHIFPALLTTALATTHRAALGSEGAGRGSLEDTVVIRSPQVSCLLFISASISCCFFFLFRFFLHSLHFYFWITFKQYARRCPLFPCFEHCFSSA